MLSAEELRQFSVLCNSALLTIIPFPPPPLLYHACCYDLLCRVREDVDLGLRRPQSSSSSCPADVGSVCLRHMLARLKCCCVSLPGKGVLPSKLSPRVPLALLLYVVDATRALRRWGLPPCPSCWTPSSSSLSRRRVLSGISLLPRRPSERSVPSAVSIFFFFLHHYSSFVVSMVSGEHPPPHMRARAAKFFFFCLG